MNAQSQHTKGPRKGPRDLRIDFFRGLALVFIFIDHIPGNGWAFATLKNFGFADSSEVFVLLAGYSAGLAYGALTERGGIGEAVKRATHRATEIYIWHIGIFVVSAVLLFTAAHVFGKPSYVDDIALRNLATEPFHAVASALALAYQPNQMNILPLYVVLMVWLPIVLLLLQRGVAVTLAVSFGIWLIANAAGLNLPAHGSREGWFFNPLAWQLLFTTGAAVSVLARRAEAHPRAELLIPAGLYVAFAFLVAAPWVNVPGLPHQPLIAPDAMAPMSKHDLSAWRFVHILALAYIVAALVPASSAWLRRPAASAVAYCGIYSLEIFALGTLLSFLGWICLNELGSNQLTMFVVNVAGIAIMGMTAWYMSRRRLQSRPTLAAPTLAQHDTQSGLSLGLS